MPKTATYCWSVLAKSSLVPAVRSSARVICWLISLHGAQWQCGMCWGSGQALLCSAVLWEAHLSQHQPPQPDRNTQGYTHLLSLVTPRIFQKLVWWISRYIINTYLKSFTDWYCINYESWQQICSVGLLLKSEQSKPVQTGYFHQSANYSQRVRGILTSAPAHMGAQMCGELLNNKSHISCVLQ